ncbi:MAG: glycosyltransferase family 4 protein [Anaerolineae bacterium]|nr:glycosyltransferase family 4 protein [Anaerolineae bacterium]
MRIGLIVNGRLNTISSGHLYDAQLVNCLYERGDDVEVISLAEAGFSHALKYNFNRAFFNNLRRADFDLLLQDARAYPSLFWLNHKLRPEIPYPIVSIVNNVQHEAEWRPWLKFGYRHLEQRYFETADALICSSRMARVAVEKLLPDGEKRPSMVAYPGSDRLPGCISQHEIVARAQKPGPLHVLFVGSYEQRQALFSLVSALNYLPSYQWRLDVVSDFVVESGAVRRWLQPVLDMVDIRENITFCGMPTEEAMVEIYRRNQVAVVPDGDGIFSAAIVEAMGFGLAVIGTTRGASIEIIKHGRNGYRLTPNNSIPLARHLALLIQNRRLLLRLGLEAHNRYQTHPTWAESMCAVRDFLVEVVDRNHSFAPADWE